LRAPDPSRITDPLGVGYRMYAAADPDNDLEALAISALQMWPEGYPLKLGGEGLGRVRIPVLIVNGSEDHPYVDSDELLADAIPGAQLVTLPGADHLGAVMHPGFKDAVRGFLSEH
jgi:pimeloyl-ACP methyl ester carboxylesterase